MHSFLGSVRAGYTIAIVAGLLVSIACSNKPDPRNTNFRIDKPGISAQYDEKSGRLKKLEVDSDKDGRIDTWTFIDGTQIDRIEIDRDQNNVVERWEYYVNNKLDHVGTSRRGDGVPDEFAYQDASGALARIETDSDRDGRIDKWETFDPPSTPGGPPVLRTVSFDPDTTGKPTRRLIYATDGTFERVERVQ